LIAALCRLPVGSTLMIDHAWCSSPGGTLCHVGTDASSGAAPCPHQRRCYGGDALQRLAQV